MKRLVPAPLKLGGSDQSVLRIRRIKLALSATCRVARGLQPTDNAYVESFNGTLRAECLDVHWFATLTEAKQVIEDWRREYNESRPRRSLGERTPNEFASQIAASRDLTCSTSAGD